MTESEESIETDEQQQSELLRMAAEVLDDDRVDDATAPEQVINRMARVFLHEQYKGAFPHPSFLRGYSEIVENGAERAFVLTEEEQKHRHECEHKIISSRIVAQEKFDADRRLVIIFAFIAVMVLVLGALILAILGKTIGAGILGAASLLAAAGALLVKRRSPDDDA